MEDAASLRTDTDLAMEDEISLLNDNLDQLNQKLAVFRFKGQARQTVDLDVFQSGVNIFSLAAKSVPLHQLNEQFCYSCQEHRFQKEKFKKYCEFCGHACCEPCTLKRRIFPKGKLKKDGSVDRGMICQVCERRILLQ